MIEEPVTALIGMVTTSRKLWDIGLVSSRQRITPRMSSTHRTLSFSLQACCESLCFDVNLVLPHNHILPYRSSTSWVWCGSLQRGARSRPQKWTRVNCIYFFRALLFSDLIWQLHNILLWPRRCRIQRLSERPSGHLSLESSPVHLNVSTVSYAWDVTSLWKSNIGCGSSKPPFFRRIRNVELNLNCEHAT
jgi:hypothetical protein